MAKGAIELTANFLVMFILAIVIFSLGLVLAKSMFSGSTDIADKTFAQLDKSVGELSCMTGERVCISTKSISLERGSFGQVAVAVENVLNQPETQNEDTFTMRVEQRLAVDPSGAAMSAQLEWLPRERSDIIIPRKGTRTVGVGIQVPEDAPSGTYSFDVTVEYGASQPYHEGRTYTFYVKVP